MNNTKTDRRPAQGRGAKTKLLAATAIIIGVGAVALDYAGVFSAASAALPPPPPPLVTVSTPLRESPAAWTDFTGQFSAVDDVQIRAQVSGYLTEIDFTDGQIVHKGALLFVIDPRPYAIALQQANAAVQTAKAQLLYAGKEVQRISALQGSGAATKEQYDQRQEDQATAQAALAQANAAVAAAELNLEFCHITAPFTGRISTHRVSVGNLVASGTTLLTTLVSLDPIHLDFQMSEDDYLTYEHYLHAATPNNIVLATLSDETSARQGKLDFVDNAIDAGTGTIHIRATFPNHDLFITPGAFAQLKLPTSASQSVLLLPDSAVSADQSDEVVMTVAADGTVVPKIVQTGPLARGLREITAGLADKDRVIIDGLMRAMPGAKVTPQSGSIAPTTQN